MTPPLTRIGGHDVLFVMAARAEYGPALAACMEPLFTGVGPIEAALATSEALTRLALAGTPPALVVNLGSAGSARLAHCGVYQVSAVSWRDIDATALGFAPGTVPFLGQPAVQPLPLRLPTVPEATLSTGANVVSGTAYDTIAEDMVDMETYAVLRACQRVRVPLLGLRGISDGQAPLGGLHDWTHALPILDRHLAEALDGLPSLLAGPLGLP